MIRNRIQSATLVVVAEANIASSEVKDAMSLGLVGVVYYVKYLTKCPSINDDGSDW